MVVLFPCHAAPCRDQRAPANGTSRVKDSLEGGHASRAPGQANCFSISERDDKPN